MNTRKSTYNGRFCFFIILGLFTVTSFGQDFHKIENVDSGSYEVITSIVKLDQNHVLLTSTGESAGHGSPFHMINRNLSTDTLQVAWKKTYYNDIDFDTDPLRVTFNSNDNLIITGTTIHHESFNLDLDEGDEFICEMTTNGDVLWSKSLGEKPLKNWAVDVVQTENGNYVTAGWKNVSENSIIPEATIRMLSSSGDSLWTQTIGDTSIYERSFKGRVVLQGDANSIFFLYQKRNPFYFSLSKFDGTTGLLVWDKEFKKGESTIIYNALMNVSGNIVMSTYVRYSDYCEPAIWEIDQNGNVIEYKGYFDELGCSSGGNIELMNDGGYGFLQYGFNHPHFVKVYPNYDLEFIKIYPIENFMSPTGVVQMGNGNYILAGYEGATEEFAIWIIKTDSTGDFVTIFSPEMPSNNIKVYPNPTSDYLLVELQQGHNSDIRLTLISVDSRIVFNQVNSETLDISSIRDGLYFLHIYEGDKLLAIEKIVKKSE